MWRPTGRNIIGISSEYHRNILYGSFEMIQMPDDVRDLAGLRRSMTMSSTSNPQNSHSNRCISRLWFGSTESTIMQFITGWISTPKAENGPVWQVAGADTSPPNAIEVRHWHFSEKPSRSLWIPTGFHSTSTKVCSSIQIDFRSLPQKLKWILRLSS